MLSIGVITRGKYGKRLLDTITSHTEFTVSSTPIPSTLPDLIDEPASFVDNLNLDPCVLSSDLVITYSLHPDIAPEMARRAACSGAKAIIIPGGWSNAGDPRELERISERYKTRIVVEDICCEMENDTNPIISEFASMLGRPLLEVQVESGKIREVKVIRGAPCGSTWWMAKQLKGAPVSEAPARGGLLIQQYPCRAMRGVGGGIHRSARLHRQAVEKAIENNLEP
ncbi:MAG: DUF166 domain-containing protein [ANME-2 cluster archaeon]|nr:DUF166 domain-containing protein [ANME-2 cluster archaeon]